MSGNHSTTDSDTLGAGSVTPPGRDKFNAYFDTKTAPELGDLLTAAERARDEAVDERDNLTERVAELVTEGNELRALIAEIIAGFSTTTGEWYLTGVSPAQIAKWRIRAGLEG